MKCIKCGTDNNLKERTDNGGRCKNCNHPFAFDFDPYENGPVSFTYRGYVTDEFLAKALEDISAANTRFFTERQLFYILEKRLTRINYLFVWLPMWIGIQVLLALFAILVAIKFIESANIPFANLPNRIVLIAIDITKIGENGPEIIITKAAKELFLIISTFLFLGGQFLLIKPISLETRKYNAVFVRYLAATILVGGILGSAILDSFLLFMFSITTGLLSIYLGFQELARITNSRPQFLISKEQFQTWLNRWQEIHNPIGKMLPPAPEESLPAEVSTELTSYSFERAVICDSSAIAQLLIANNFHLENNCAVLSVTGYPQSIFSTVLEMLSQNPDLKVYALHDASPRGVTLAHHLRTSPNWFQNCNVIIHDLGLLPRQIFASRNVFIRISEDSAREAKEMQVEVSQSFSASELEWLEAGNFVELESFSPQKLIQVLNQGIAQSQSANAGDSLVVIDGGGGYLYAADSFG
jgi:hypothetical protein